MTLREDVARKHLAAANHLVAQAATSTDPTYARLYRKQARILREWSTELTRSEQFARLCKSLAERQLYPMG